MLVLEFYYSLRSVSCRAAADTNVTTSLNKIMSVSSSMASKLYSNIKHTVKEYQAPSTVSVTYKQEKTTDNQSKHSNEDAISM